MVRFHKHNQFTTIMKAIFSQFREKKKSYMSISFKSLVLFIKFIAMLNSSLKSVNVC